MGHPGVVEVADASSIGNGGGISSYGCISRARSVLPCSARIFGAAVAIRTRCCWGVPAMKPVHSGKNLAIAYAATIFLSAFLLFQVQPLIGKFILPWFGGSPAVWTTCMLVFQSLLFGGYAYAHVSSRCLRPRQQACLHLALLAAALATLPVT